MRFTVINCEGFNEAICGAMLSKGVTDYNILTNLKETFTGALKERAIGLAQKLSGADGGHNKFLEQIQYWIVIDAPLYWWKHFDTYRIGVSKSSESTMFKMWKKGVTQEDFEGVVYKETLELLNKDISEYAKDQSNTNLFRNIINNIPDGYFQTRLVNINAKSLRNIYAQRKNHKLKEWRDFCKAIEGFPYGDLITNGLRGD
jgi:hypothetical protein